MNQRCDYNDEPAKYVVITTSQGQIVAMQMYAGAFAATSEAHRIADEVATNGERLHVLLAMAWLSEKTGEFCITTVDVDGLLPTDKKVTP